MTITTKPMALPFPFAVQHIAARPPDPANRVDFARVIAGLTPVSPTLEKGGIVAVSTGLADADGDDPPTEQEVEPEFAEPADAAEGEALPDKGPEVAAPVPLPGLPQPAEPITQAALAPASRPPPAPAVPVKPADSGVMTDTPALPRPVAEGWQPVSGGALRPPDNRAPEKPERSGDAMRLRISQTAVPMLPARPVIAPALVADLTERPNGSPAIGSPLAGAEPGAEAEVSLTPAVQAAAFPLGEAASTGAAATGLRTPNPQAPPAPSQVIAAIEQSGGQGAIEIALAPDELGRVRMQLLPDGDNLRVTILVERPETMDLFRRNAEGFLNDMRQAGYCGATLHFSDWAGGPPQRSAGKSSGDTAAAAPADDPPPPPARLPVSGLYLRL